MHPRVVCVHGKGIVAGFQAVRDRAQHLQSFRLTGVVVIGGLPAAAVQFGFKAGTIALHPGAKQSFSQFDGSHLRRVFNQFHAINHVGRNSDEFYQTFK